MRTPTARLPVGSGNSDGAATVVVGGTEVRTVGEAVEREVARRSAVVLPQAESMIATPMPAIARVRNVFIFRPPGR